ncbi:MAG TPA: 30S ribosomal protein S19 [Candidatus Binatus sp.]|nr:30S ribosomal protein S19 [Candidatus Binatus sp.]
MPRVFTYRGHTVDELKQMSMDEFIKLLPSRQRRSLTKGLTNEQRTLWEHIRASKRHNGGSTGKGAPTGVKTQCRDMIIIPEMLGLTLQLHSGKEFTALEIRPEMIGHYIGELVITNQKVVHGTPGIGASRSSMYVPLK